MAIFKSRLASPEDILYGFAAVAFPIHIWSIINMMREVPAWILRLSTWDVVGVLAYAQMFTLFETVLIFLGLLLLSAALPARIIRDKFLAVISGVIFLTSIWFIFLHYNSGIIEAQRLLPLLLWGMSYLLVSGLFFFVLYRSRKVEESINSFVRRLAVLSFLYIFIDVVCIIVVIVRNV